MPSSGGLTSSQQCQMLSTQRSRVNPCLTSSQQCHFFLFQRSRRVRSSRVEMLRFQFVLIFFHPRWPGEIGLHSEGVVSKSTDSFLNPRTSEAYRPGFLALWSAGSSWPSAFHPKLVCFVWERSGDGGYCPVGLSGRVSGQVGSVGRVPQARAQ